MTTKMKRRDFITLLGGAAATWPLAARAQRAESIRRIGVLMGIPETDLSSPAFVAALRRGLQQRGWTEGQNIQIDYRWWTTGNPDELRAAAKELVDRHPDVLVAHTLNPGKALKNETRTIPIVFCVISDPYGGGLIENIAHPGGNITGFTNLELTMGTKWAEMLIEIAPQIRRIAVLCDPETTPTAAPFAPPIEAAAQRFAASAFLAPVHAPSEIEPVVMELKRETGGGLITPPDLFAWIHRKLIAELAARYRIPAVYPYRAFVDAGGLMSYGTDPPEQFGLTAIYVDRILRGTSPSVLPVQGPTRFRLVINLKAAEGLGLNVPPTLLARADEVIE
jgi:putative ABC transport system substrate-binding protein